MFTGPPRDHDTFGPFGVGGGRPSRALETVARRSQTDRAMALAHGFGCTRAGRRSHNEDHFCVEPSIGLFAVADGMGGYEGGELASRVVVDTLTDFFERMTHETDPGWDPLDGGARSPIEHRMDMAVRRAQREVRRAMRPGLEDMGTTLAAVLVRDGQTIIAHLGDSRVYRLRRGTLTQLTQDHSLYEEMRAAGTDGADRAHAGMMHVITRAITTRHHFDPDTRIERIEEGDRFLLSSDGLTDVLSEEEIARVLAATPEPEVASKALVEKAYAAGSTDNITAVVVTT